MPLTPLQRALSDQLTIADFPSAYKQWTNKETSPEEFRKKFLEAYYPAKALEDSGVTAFLVPSFDLLTRSENELKEIDPDLALDDAEFMTRVMDKAKAAARKKPRPVAGAASAQKGKKIRGPAKEQPVVIKEEPQSPPPLKRIKTHREGKGKASTVPRKEDVIILCSDSEEENLLPFDWSQQSARPLVKGKYKHEAPPAGHRIVSNNVMFVLQMRKCQRCESSGFDCYLPDSNNGRSCFKCKATHVLCVFKPLQDDELFRPSKAVMDIVGHYELPACHINPETATLEDCDYAIDLGRFCIAYYDRFCESLNELIRDKLDTNAGGSVAV